MSNLFADSFIKLDMITPDHSVVIYVKIGEVCVVQSYPSKDPSCSVVTNHKTYIVKHIAKEVMDKLVYAAKAVR